MAEISYKILSEDETHLQVGLHHIENVPTLVTPLYLDFKEKFRSNTLLLMRVLEKYKNLKKNTEFNNSNIGTSNVFYTYIWIIKNYFEYGLFEEKNKVTMKNQKGRIDFSKTISREIPYKSGDNFVYKDVHATISTVRMDSYLQQIQKIAVKKSITEAGWLLGLERNPITQVEKIPSSEAIYFLKNALNATNNDSQIELIKKLLVFYQGESFDESHEIEKKHIRVDDFKDVFNHMITTIFKTNELDMFLENLSIELDENYEFEHSVDILRQFKDKLYLVYPHYSRSSSLPSKSQIQKLLKLSTEIDDSTDVIILVASEEENVFKYIGKSYDEKVTCHFFKIDLLYIMRTFVGFDTLDKLDELFV